MTPSTSLVAVWYSSDSLQLPRSRLLRLEQPRVLDGDDGLVGEGLKQFNLRCQRTGRAQRASQRWSRWERHRASSARQTIARQADAPRDNARCRRDPIHRFDIRYVDDARAPG